MKITIHSGNWEELDIDALAVLQAPRHTDPGRPPGRIARIARQRRMDRQSRPMHADPSRARVLVQRLFLLGVGAEPMPRHWFAAAGQAVRQAAKAKCRSVAILPEGADARLMAEGAIYACTGRAATRIRNRGLWRRFLLAGAEPAEADRGQLTGLNLARELVIPANDLGRRLRAPKKARRPVWKWKCLTKRPSPKWAPALLAVGQGSVRPPRLVFSYVPKSRQRSPLSRRQRHHL